MSSGIGAPELQNFDGNFAINAIRYATDALNHVNFSGRTFDNILVFKGGELTPPPPPPIGQARLRWNRPITNEDGSILDFNSVREFILYRKTSPGACNNSASLVGVSKNIDSIINSRSCRMNSR